MRWIASVVMIGIWAMTVPALGEEAASTTGPEEHRKGEIGGPTPEAQQQPPDWHYGGFVDLGYSLDFNFPQNHQFRDRSTTPRVNELDLNMGAVYVRKDATERSRWGMEFMGQGGQDALNFAFGTNLHKVDGSDALRHFGRANVSYLAPVGNGLMLQAGLFNSLIGYESLYAKDNFNYTRAWIADYSPYLMFGANALYQFDEKWSAAVFVINEYFHLQNANSLPSYGAQVAYKPGKSWLLKETVYYGPDQSDTSLRYWRSFSDSIVEWKPDEAVTVAAEYQVGTQEMAAPGNPRVFYMGTAWPMRWHILGPWSAALRPELYWDRSGLMTGHEQFIKAVTTTAEYKVPYKWINMIARLEYRYDESRGPQGGFFKGNDIAPGVVGLTPAQHMLIFGLIWTMDSP
ncbi:MAG TPA: outer membrane beta-barrel protein [Nitrospira sp.]|nr:outer membrane beta-barrel protein [Nitrospira sp.]